MKLFSLLFLLLFIFGCTKDGDPKEIKMIVITITETYPNKATYHVHTYGGWGEFMGRVSFVDVTNLYHVGDTLLFRRMYKEK